MENVKFTNSINIEPPKILIISQYRQIFLALNSLEWTVCVVYKKGQMHDKHWYCNAVPKLRLSEYKSKIC